jgi:hypothetical protein
LILESAELAPSLPVGWIMRWQCGERASPSLLEIPPEKHYGNYGNGLHPAFFKIIDLPCNWCM